MVLTNAERQARYRERHKAPAPRKPAPKRAKTGSAPFTVPHFRQWCRRLELDNGDQMETEPFQEAFAADLFAGVPECWLIIPEGNAKTTLFAALGLYHIEHRRSAMVPVAASARDQAQIMYQQGDGFVQRSELTGFRLHPGYRRIAHPGMLSMMQFQAADDRTGDGVIPTLALLDELHRHRDLRLYRTWRGKLLKRKGQIGAISTRGEPGSEFETAVGILTTTATDIATDGGFMRAAGPGFVLHQWAVPEGADVTDMAVVKGANPLKAITVEALAEKFASPTMTRHHWVRFVCNRPTRDDDVWLGPDGDRLWMDLERDIKPTPGAPTWVGVDIAMFQDSSAVCIVQDIGDGHLGAWVRIWVPTPGKPVDITDVMHYVRELDHTYKLGGVSFDPRFFDVPAKMLEDNGLPMNKVDQSVERMTPIIGNLYGLINRGVIHHDGDPAFTAHVLNAVPRQNDRGFTLAKAKSRGKIDACIALSLAVDQYVHRKPTRSPLFVGSTASRSAVAV